MMPESARELLQEALDQGGRRLLHYANKQVPAKVKESISSVVTEADLAAEEVILNILGRSEWKANIITEESGFMDHQSSFTWVVDPLDGTSNFAAGLPWFGIIITLFEGVHPILAGMHIPMTGDYFFGGSWRRKLEEWGKTSATNQG